MTYAQPTLSTLRAAVSRDLHDEANETFSSAEVTDMVNGGISELNRLVPKEYRETIPLTEGQYEYDIPTDVNAAPVSKVFSVEWWRNSVDGVLTFSRVIDPRNDQSTSGWDYWDGALLLPTYFNWNSDDNDSVVVMGYQERVGLTDDDDVADLTLDGENVVRSYCAFTAFQRLIASRALFQQWQTNANNADVSATQLIGMAATYSREWRELRMRVRRLRRAG